MEPEITLMQAWKFLDKDGVIYLRLNHPQVMWFKPTFKDEGDDEYGFVLLADPAINRPIEAAFIKAGGEQLQ